MLNLFINSALIENMVFAYFFGMCSYIAVSKSVKTALGLGAAVTFVQVMTVPLNFLLNKYVLSPDTCILGQGVDLSFLSFILFIAVIAAFVQLVEMIVEKFSPSLYNQLGIFLPLIAVNCAIMGDSLFMQQMVGSGEIVSVGDSIVYGLGSGIGWWLAIVMMAAIREKIEYSHIPAAMKGPGIAFIITGLMGIAFMIFSGIQLDKLGAPEKVAEEAVVETVVEDTTETVDEVVIDNADNASEGDSAKTVED